MQPVHHGLTLLILHLNALVDSGRYDSISLKEVKDHIRAGTIVEFLEKRAGSEADFSMLTDNGPYGKFKRFFITSLQSLQDAYGGDERRKWGVENRGLCLLIAWTNEILQLGSGWQPNPNMANVEYP